MPTKLLIIEHPTEKSVTIPNLATYGFQTFMTRKDDKYIKAIEDIQPDVIIINETQPERKNGAIYENIRAISQAPILVTSVVEKPGIVECVLDQGADEYLIRPFSTKILIAHLKALARRAKA